MLRMEVLLLLPLSQIDRREGFQFAPRMRWTEVYWPTFCHSATKRF